MRDAALHDPPELSFVITCFNEERGIEEFYARLRKTIDLLELSSETILVNDGSTDQTWSKLLEIQARDPDVTLLDLVRNSGQCAAISAGVVEARGRHFVFMDSDLQLDPEELPELLRPFQKGQDVVNGVRRQRRDTLRRRIPSWLANRVLRGVAGVPFTDFGCTFQIMRGELVRAHGFGPEKAFNNVLVARSAGRCCEVLVSHHERPYGESGWTTVALWRYLVDNMVLYSQGLFQYFSLFALVIALLTLVRIFLPGSILASVSHGLLLNAVLLSSAAVLAVVGFVGEYVLRTFATHARGPLYIVRELRPSRRSLADARSRAGAA
jgi:glycosyltransferase involved in cell wall biosynthesis